MKNILYGWLMVLVFGISVSGCGDDYIEGDEMTIYKYPYTITDSSSQEFIFGNYYSNGQIDLPSKSGEYEIKLEKLNLTYFYSGKIKESKDVKNWDITDISLSDKHLPYPISNTEKLAEFGIEKIYKKSHNTWVVSLSENSEATPRRWKVHGELEGQKLPISDYDIEMTQYNANSAIDQFYAGDINFQQMWNIYSNGSWNGDKDVYVHNPDKGL
ncbi:MAG: hypothetical protein NC201_03335 [Prevotella sp.]|nr:hypothetical protein [Bacteroides sp.]MCM1366261.1 hypothetical protein [Prevotella sp.]MCM1436334.1 hypothetical protein [Prevotella sp.]